MQHQASVEEASISREGTGRETGRPRELAWWRRRLSPRTLAVSGAMERCSRRRRGGGSSGIASGWPIRRAGPDAHAPLFRLPLVLVAPDPRHSASRWLHAATPMRLVILASAAVVGGALSTDRGGQGPPVTPTTERPCRCRSWRSYYKGFVPSLANASRVQEGLAALHQRHAAARLEIDWLDGR